MYRKPESHLSLQMRTFKVQVLNCSCSEQGLSQNQKLAHGSILKVMRRIAWRWLLKHCVVKQKHADSSQCLVNQYSEAFFSPHDVELANPSDVQHSIAFITVARVTWKRLALSINSANDQTRDTLTKWARRLEGTGLLNQSKGLYVR